jgi:peptide/nickel transport system permease protein
MTESLPTLTNKTTKRRWHIAPRLLKLLRHPLAVLGLLLLISFAVVALIAPVITASTIAERVGGHTCGRDLGIERGDAGEAQLRNPLTPQFWRAIFLPPASCLTMPKVTSSRLPQPPSTERLFGTLPGGYDILYGVVWGIRTAFMLGVLVSLINFVIGFIIGGCAGYFGGRTDALLMRFAEVVQAFPSLVFAILFVALCGRSLINSLIALSLVGWVSYARIIRADILRVKQQEFVDGARALGANRWRIFFKHIIPNSLNSLIVVVVLDISSIVLTGATLAFVGLGFREGAADWGQMFAFSRSYFLGPTTEPLRFWYVSFFPGIAMTLFALSFNLIGNAYQEVFDVRA